jgi:hypothetical protein
MFEMNGTAPTEHALAIAVASVAVSPSDVQSIVDVKMPLAFMFGSPQKRVVDQTTQSKRELLRVKSLLRASELPSNP